MDDKTIHLKTGALVRNERHRRWGQVVWDPSRFQFETGDPTRIQVWDTERRGTIDWLIADISVIAVKGKVVWEDPGLADELDKAWREREPSLPKVVTLKMGRPEAWAMFRATGVAAESDRTAAEDKPRLGWVGERLSKLLDPNFFGEPLPAQRDA
jgi:hypothetical protein